MYALNCQRGMTVFFMNECAVNCYHCTRDTFLKYELKFFDNFFFQAAKNLSKGRLCNVSIDISHFFVEMYSLYKAFVVAVFR